VIVSAPVFGVGSALYYYVLARARSVPGLLAYFGVLSSVLLVIAIPLEPLQIVRARWPSIYGCLRLSSNWCLPRGSLWRESPHLTSPVTNMKKS